MKNDNLIDIFEKDLKSKILQKMVPNLTEEQTLVKYFKYFDLENSGFCTIRDWIKAVEKIGIIVSKTSELQKIFKHYDTEDKGIFNYKKFANNLFSLSKQIISNSQSKQNVIDVHLKNDVSFDKLHLYLKPKRGRFLINLFKEFKLSDYNESNRLNIDEFIRIITENKISMPISEVQILFHNYDLKNSGYFYYNEMFKDLMNAYSGDKRKHFLTGVYDEIINKFGRTLKVADLKTLFKGKEHPQILSGKFSQDDVEQEYFDMLDSFQFIKNLAKNDSCFSKDDFIEFFIFYGFGIEDFEFFQLVDKVILPDRVNQKSNKSLNNPVPKKILEKTDISNNKEIKETYELKLESNLEKISQFLDKLRKNIKTFGKKSLFSLIKHFKFYDNNTKFINRFDFVKVLKDFRLNLSVTEIEKIFDGLCEKSQLLNYENFISVLNKNLSDNRINAIQDVYRRIKTNSKEVTIDILKFFYSSKIKSENEFINEYFDCLEIFHYILKGKKDKKISLEQFIEFYQIMEFFYEKDEEFESDLRVEWKKILKSNLLEETKQKIVPQLKQQENIPNSEMIKQMTPMLNKRDFDSCNILDSKQITREDDKSNDDRESRHSRQEKKERVKVMAKEENFNKNVYSNKNAQKETQPLIINIIAKLKKVLRNRKIRGLMNLHKQFLVNCSNLKSITLGDFIKVLKLQRIEFSQEDYELLFDYFKEKSQPKFLDFLRFLKFFKVQLEGKRLTVVEDTFINLDTDQTGRLVMDDLRMKFNADGHPEIKAKLSNSDDVLMEFFDTFELNYNFLVATENENDTLISFQEFANYYEYVSFVYEEDDLFVDVISSTWKF